MEITVHNICDYPKNNKWQNDHSKKIHIEYKITFFKGRK